MTHTNSFLAKVLAAVAIGLIIASTLTDATYPCNANDMLEGDSIARCIAWDEVVLHPSDLMSNREGSLLRFLTTFVVTALVSYAIISIVSRAYRKKFRST